MDMRNYRQELDIVDTELIKIFEKRMDISTKIAEYKAKNNVAILDKAREEEKLGQVREISRPEYAEYTKLLYLRILELSRARQHEINER